MAFFFLWILFFDYVMKNNMKIYAAPLQGYTETAWRNTHAKVFGGVDAYCIPFVRMEKGGIRNKDKREINVCNNTAGHLIPQVIAADDKEFRTLAEYVHAMGYNEIDFNMGCPFPMMANHGKGAGILSYPDRLKRILDVMEEMSGICFSVKMRLGWQDADEWKSVLPLLNESCISQIVLHPRVGKQQYRGSVDKTKFDDFYAECEKPLVYNGDLCTLDDVDAVVDAWPGLHGVMIGRGLLANPALAEEIRQGECWTKDVLYAKVAEMHHGIYLQYAQQIEGGEAQLLAKLKTVWEYLLPDIAKKQRKAILKSTKLESYLKLVDEILVAPS